MSLFFFFFFQAEDGIRDPLVTGVQTCALPICWRIDLVITDVVMPRTGGPRLAEVLVSLSLQVKVLFVSGYSENVVRRKGLTDSTERFLPKPFSLQVLALKIWAILEEPTVARAAAAGRG